MSQPVTVSATAAWAPALCGDTALLETAYFTLKIPVHPHVPACDGGHLFLEVNDPAVSDRTELAGPAATECMWLTMLAGEAMAEVLPSHGIDLYRINYQDNGNWSFLRGERPRMHIHLYGRARDEASQTFGQALFFPDPRDGRYGTFEPIDPQIGREIAARMEALAAEPRYAWHKPSYLARPA